MKLFNKKFVLFILSFALTQGFATQSGLVIHNGALYENTVIGCCGRQQVYTCRLTLSMQGILINSCTGRSPSKAVFNEIQSLYSLWEQEALSGRKKNPPPAVLTFNRLHQMEEPSRSFTTPSSPRDSLREDSHSDSSRIRGREEAVSSSKNPTEGSLEFVTKGPFPPWRQVPTDMGEAPKVGEFLYALDVNSEFAYQKALKDRLAEAPEGACIVTAEKYVFWDAYDNFDKGKFYADAWNIHTKSGFHTDLGRSHTAATIEFNGKYIGTGREIRENKPWRPMEAPVHCSQIEVWYMNKSIASYQYYRPRHIKVFSVLHPEKISESTPLVYWPNDRVLGDLPPNAKRVILNALKKKGSLSSAHQISEPFVRLNTAPSSYINRTAGGSDDCAIEVERGTVGHGVHLRRRGIGNGPLSMSGEPEPIRSVGSWIGNPQGPRDVSYDGTNVWLDGSPVASGKCKTLTIWETFHDFENRKIQSVGRRVFHPERITPKNPLILVDPEQIPQIEGEIHAVEEDKFPSSPASTAPSHFSSATPPVLPPTASNPLFDTIKEQVERKEIPKMRDEGFKDWLSKTDISVVFRCISDQNKNHDFVGEAHFFPASQSRKSSVALYLERNTKMSEREIYYRTLGIGSIDVKYRSYSLSPGHQQHSTGKKNGGETIYLEIAPGEPGQGIYRETSPQGNTATFKFVQYAEGKEDQRFVATIQRGEETLFCGGFENILKDPDLSKLSVEELKRELFNSNYKRRINGLTALEKLGDDAGGALADISTLINDKDYEIKDKVKDIIKKSKEKGEVVLSEIGKILRDERHVIGGNLFVSDYFIPAISSLKEMALYSDKAMQLLFDLIIEEGAPNIQERRMDLLQEIYFSGERGKAAIPYFLRLMEIPDEDKMVDVTAATALGRLGADGKDAVKPLIKMLSSGKTPREKVAAAEAIKGLAKHFAEEFNPALKEALKSDSIHIQTRVAYALVEMGPEYGKAAVPVLIEHLKFKQEEGDNIWTGSYRGSALANLAKLGKYAAPAIPHLKQILEEKTTTDSEKESAQAALDAIQKSL